MPRLNTGIYQALAVPDLVDGLASLCRGTHAHLVRANDTLLRDETEFLGRPVKLIGFTPEA